MTKRINATIGDYQYIPFSFVDSMGNTHALSFFVATTEKQDLSLENFCGVDLLKMIEMIRGKE